jgi:hypothetical protein
MVIRPIGPSPNTPSPRSTIWPARTAPFRSGITGSSADTTFTPIKRIGSDQTPPPQVASALYGKATTAAAAVVSELVSTNPGGSVTTITTYDDGQVTTRTSHARFNSSGALEPTDDGRGSLVNLLV